jgi:hypothetical protein
MGVQDARGIDGWDGASLADHLNKLGVRGWEVCGFETHRTAGVLQRRLILKRSVLIAALPD